MKTINNYPVKYTCMPRIVNKQEGDKIIEEIDLWVPTTCLVLSEENEGLSSLYNVVYLREQYNLNKKEIDFDNLNIETTDTVSDDYEEIKLKCEKLNSKIFANKFKSTKDREFIIKIQEKLFSKCFESLDEKIEMKK